MPQFLAETYAPRDAADVVALRGKVALAPEQVNQETAPVCLLGAIVVPEDETCFFLYQAPSADAVHEAMTRAGRPPERITQAVSIGWTAAELAGETRLFPGGI